MVVKPPLHVPSTSPFLCRRTVLDPFLNGTKNNDFDAKCKLSLNSKFSLSNSYISPYKYTLEDKFKCEGIGVVHFTKLHCTTLQYNHTNGIFFISFLVIK